MASAVMASAGMTSARRVNGRFLKNERKDRQKLRGTWGAASFRCMSSRVLSTSWDGVELNGALAENSGNEIESHEPTIRNLTRNP